MAQDNNSNSGHISNANRLPKSAASTVQASGPLPMRKRLAMGITKTVDEHNPNGGAAISTKPTAKGGW